MRFDEIIMADRADDNFEEKPLISIITVVFNALDVLEMTIISVLDQTYDNIEYILIDGGSTDGTIDLIKNYEDKIAYWVSEPDNGIYDAMNKGLKIATGKWVNFMNAGDTFLNNNIISEISVSFPDADILYGDYNKIWRDHVEIIKPPRKINRFTLLVYFGINHQTLFAKKGLISGFNCKYTIAADYDWLLRLYGSGNIKFKYLNKILINYDPYGSSNTIATHYEFLEILKEHYGLLSYSYYKTKWWVLEILKKLIRTKGSQVQF
jgi:glycosyltransferase involved in cell wall biosynthesis